MDLTGYLREGSLQNLGWLGDDLKAISPQIGPKKNNIKPEAQKQWGLEKTEPVFESGAGEVKRALSEEDSSVTDGVIRFARDLMNKGAEWSDIQRQLGAKFPVSSLKKASNELAILAKKDGMVGRFVIDATGYKNCKLAAQSVKASPYKRFIKFIIGCNCGDHHFVESSDDRMKLSSSSGNGIQDFLSDDVVYSKKMIPLCASTMIPILARGDLDEEWLDSGLIELEASFGLLESDKKLVKGTSHDVVTKMKLAFNLIDKRKREKRLASDAKNYKSDASSFALKKADFNVDLQKPAQGPLSVDLHGKDIGPDALSENPSVKLPELGKVNLSVGIAPFEIQKAPVVPNDDIQLSRVNGIGIKTAPVLPPAPKIVLQEPKMEVELGEVLDGEINPQGFLEDEFKDSGNIVLDDNSNDNSDDGEVILTRGMSW